MGGEVVAVPGNVCVANLTSVDDVAVDGLLHPVEVGALVGQDEIRVVAFKGHWVVGPDVALKRALVAEYFFAADPATVVSLPKVVTRRGSEYIVLFIELTDQHSMTAGNVTVELPLLPEDCVAADVPALVAPLLVLPDVVLHRWDIVNFLKVRIDRLLVGDPDVDAQIGLVHEELFWVGFAQLAVLSHFPGDTQTKAALVVVLVDVVHILQVVGVISIDVVKLVT